MSFVAVVGFGSNLGDRLRTLRAALRELGRVSRVEKTSHVYATAPIGPVSQPEFLNAAAMATYPGTPEELLDALLAIEARLGRVRSEKWGPRTIDLDVLWAGDVVIDTPRLQVPHPLLLARAFALVPLLELVPDAIDPHTGDKYAVPPEDVRITPDVL